MKELYAKLVTFDAGYDCQKETMRELFIMGQYYKVDRIEMGQSSTDVYLKGFTISFNSVFFKFYTRENEKFVKYDIFSDPDYNPYIERKSYTFEDKDGIVRTFKVGDEVVEIDGYIGEIVGFCDCSECKKRGFYEPFVQFKKIDHYGRDYIDKYDRDSSFSSFYKIGGMIFGSKPTKESVSLIIKEIQERIDTYTSYLPAYKNLLEKL